MNCTTNRIVLAFCIMLVANFMTAQEAVLQNLNKKYDAQGILKFQKFDNSGTTLDETKRMIETELLLDDKQELNKISETTDALGFTHTKYQQIYNGVPVEYKKYTLHSKNGTVEVMNGEYSLIEDFDTTPTLSEADALTSALNFIDADEYMWDTEDNEKWAMKSENKESFYPTGELVIVDNYRGNMEPTLAYKFNIYASNPLSRDFIYVDAQNGAIVHVNPIIKHCFHNTHAHTHADHEHEVAVPFATSSLASLAAGTAATRYSGTRDIEANATSGGFYLRETTRGGGIETYNMKELTRYNRADDFVDNDNNWTAAEWDNANKNNAALDAHWGAEMTYDYFIQYHNRDSYDGNGAVIKSYVHYSRDYDNAFWNGSVMTYGDGSTFDALTSLDVAAHEIGHGICSSTADLVYSYESGAMNEGFSDIWAACVESFAAPEKDIWLVGEDIGQSYGPLRDMANPNAKSHPDTYLGDYWYAGSGDNGGVHYNSGVLNHCFYILTEGKSGVNDIGNSYSVNGIGIVEAAQIFYRTESVYLSSNSQYIDARNACIQSAADIFGANSSQVEETTNAFYAVGIGNAFGDGGGTGPTCTDGVQNGDETGVDCGGSCPNTCGGGTGGSCDTPVGLNVTNIKARTATLNWDAVAGASSYDVQVRAAGGTWSTDNTFNSTTNSLGINGTSKNANYEWRVRANCGSESSTYSSTCTWTGGSSNSGGCTTFTFGGEQKEITDINVFPNPVLDKLNIQLPSSYEDTMIEIVDTYGKVVLRQNVNSTFVELDVATITNGFYLLSIQNGDDVQVKKIVIK